MAKNNLHIDIVVTKTTMTAIFKMAMDVIINYCGCVKSTLNKLNRHIRKEEQLKRNNYSSGHRIYAGPNNEEEYQQR